VNPFTGDTVTLNAALRPVAGCDEEDTDSMKSMMRTDNAADVLALKIASPL
jgi:hypothetical protein